MAAPDNSQEPDKEPSLPNTPNKVGRRSYDELIDDPALSPEELNKELNAYAEALAKDLEAKNKAALNQDAANPDVTQNTKEFFQRNAAAAAAQIAWLANNAFSESVKLSAAKFIIQGAVTNENKDTDPLADLMKELQAASANQAKQSQTEPNS